jgi:hypothetical protein
MAGRVRQPFDELAFEKYLSEHVPEIVTPVDVQQVSEDAAGQLCQDTLRNLSSD